MKKFIVLAAACLVACSFLLTVPIQPASAATAWVPDDSFVLTITNKTDGWASDDIFGIYGIDSGNKLEIFKFNSLQPYRDTIAELTFYDKSMVSGTLYGYDASKKRVAIYELGPINLGTSYQFGFYFNDELDYTYTSVDGGYDLKFADGLLVTVQNVSPVPIPTAFLLLGSGLVGLVGFKRKNKN